MSKRKKILLYNIETRVIEEFSSQKEAAEHIGATQGNINNAIHGRRRWKVGEHIPIATHNSFNTPASIRSLSILAEMYSDIKNGMPFSDFANKNKLKI